MVNYTHLLEGDNKRNINGTPCVGSQGKIEAKRVVGHSLTCERSVSIQLYSITTIEYILYCNNIATANNTASQYTQDLNTGRVSGFLCYVIGYVCIE